MPDPILILGAGLTGLTCAFELGAEYRLLEKEQRPGGTARTHADDGFLFDITGHWLHLQDAGVRDLVTRLLGDALLSIERRAAIFSHGRLTPYPFQANTHGLPADVTAACVLGYFRAREAVARGGGAAPHNFAEYVRATLGDGVAEHFMLPYNQKLWTVPPEELAHDWCERFVPVPSPEEVVNGALRPGGAGQGMGYNPVLLYPRAGGIEGLAIALRAALPQPVELGVEATGIDWKRRTVFLSDGREEPYAVLVSTLPLNQLIARLRDPPPAVKAAAARLRAASVTYWDIGLARPNAPGDPHWIYFPAPELPFYRVGSASAVVPHLAPSGHRSYYVEVSHREGEPCRVGDEDIIAGLRHVGLMQANETPVIIRRRRVDCAYVIMDQSYGAARQRLLAWLTGEGILSVGRYGGWTYDSMAGAMHQGRVAARQARELLS